MLHYAYLKSIVYPLGFCHLAEFQAEAKPRRFWEFFASVTGCEWTQSRSSGPKLFTSVRHGPLLCRQKMHQHFLPECLLQKCHEGCQCCHRIVSVGGGKWPPMSPLYAMQNVEGWRHLCAWPSHSWSWHDSGHTGCCGWFLLASSALQSHIGDQQLPRGTHALLLSKSTHRNTHTKEKTGLL